MEWHKHAAMKILHQQIKILQHSISKLATIHARKHNLGSQL
jgi:hypothetical protein